MNDTVTLAHGAGGKQTNELIQRVFGDDDGWIYRFTRVFPGR